MLCQEGGILNALHVAREIGHDYATISSVCSKDRVRRPSLMVELPR